VNNHIICYIVNLKRQNRLKVGADITTVNLFSHVYKYCELLASWPAGAMTQAGVMAELGIYVPGNFRHFARKFVHFGVMCLIWWGRKYTLVIVFFYWGDDCPLISPGSTLLSVDWT